MKNEVILITGQRGQGKTTYIKDQISLFDRVIIFDLLGEFTYFDTAYDLREFFEILSEVKDENFFVLNFYNPKNSEEDFHVVCEAVNRLKDVTLVVDEIDYFCSTHSIPKQFDEIVKRGRHQALQLIVATRRPHEIPPIIRSQVSQLITFRHIEPRDLEYLRSIIEIPEEEISKLPEFHYVKWSVKGGLSQGVVEKPKKKKVEKEEDEEKEPKAENL
jgi:hypothetical protein